LVANEKASNFRTTVSGNGTAQILKWYKFKGGKVTFTNNSSMSKTVNSAQGSSDVVIAKGTLTISEPIKLKNIRILSTDKN
jgi:hypothetical protein